MTRQYDAIVIGGGPAGALTGVHLADLGWHVLLVDRRRLGAAKTCGHCLSTRALPMLKHIGLQQHTRRQSRGAPTSFQLYLEHAPAWSLRLPRGPRQDAGLLVERSRFDAALLAAARDRGVTIVQPATARIIEIDRSRSRVEVRTVNERYEAHAPVLIGADGLRSNVARRAGLAPQTRKSVETKFGFSFTFHSPQASLLDRNTIAMFVLDGGYLGVVNQGKGELHVAALVNGSQNCLPRAPRAAAAHFAARFDVLSQIGLSEIARSASLHICGAAPMPWQPRTEANDRAALVGDAAGYVEPFTGEGLTWAIESASLLRDVLAAQTIGTWTTREARRYCSLRRATIGRRQRTCRMIAWLAARPRVLRWAMRRLQHRSRLENELIRRVVPA